MRTATGTPLWTATRMANGPRTARGDGEADDLGSLPSARVSEGAGGHPSSGHAFTLRVKRRDFSKSTDAGTRTSASERPNNLVKEDNSQPLKHSSTFKKGSNVLSIKKHQALVCRCHSR